MKGHIRQRGKSSWSIVLDLGRDAGGKRRQKWHTVHGTKRDAQREIAHLLHSLHTGTYVEPSRTTVGEYFTRWLEGYAKVNVAPKTFERYEEIVKLHLTPALGAHALAKLQPLHIQGFYSAALQNGRKKPGPHKTDDAVPTPTRHVRPSKEHGEATDPHSEPGGAGEPGSVDPREKRGLSPQTVLHFHRVLREALQQAVRWQLLARNPADAVEPPRPGRRELRTLNEHESARLLEATRGTQLFVPIMIAITTGMRRGEILALRWGDVDFAAGSVAVRQSLEQTRGGLAFKRPKTQSGNRLIPLPRLAVDALRAHKVEQAKERLLLGPAYQNHDLVCATPDGRPWSPGLLTNQFLAHARRADLAGLRFHDLRHSHATQLLGYGIHPKIVSERLGHATIGITLDVYSHVLPSMQAEAALKVGAGLELALRETSQASRP